MRLRLVATCCGILAAGIIATVSFAGAPGGEHAAENAQANHDAFGVVRDRGGAAAEASEQVKAGRVLEHLRSGRFNPDDMRLAHETASAKIYVASAGGNVCLIVREKAGGGSVACTDGGHASHPNQPMMSVDRVGPGRWQVSGLVIDGARDVDVITSNGSTSASIANNVFTATVTGHPSGVEWTSPADNARHDAHFTALDK